MEKKKIDLLKIIENKISENEKYNIGLNNTKLFPEFKREDFDYIFKYVENYGSDINVSHFIIFSVNELWRELSNLEFRGNLWNKEFDDNNFIKLLFTQILNIVDSINYLIHKNKNREALSLLRNFIEISSILFACCIDEIFFNDYIKDFESENEYTNHWYNKLKPEKLKTKLSSIKMGNPQNSMLDYSIDRFVGKQRTVLYRYTSSISHAKFSQITERDLTIENDILINGIDFLVNTTLLLQIITYKHIKYTDPNVERKHQITISIWHEILYKNILI